MTNKHPELTPFQQHRDLGLKAVQVTAALTPLAFGAMAFSPLIPNAQAADLAMKTSGAVLTVSAAAGIAANKMYQNNDQALMDGVALAGAFQFYR